MNDFEEFLEKVDDITSKLQNLKNDNDIVPSSSSSSPSSTTKTFQEKRREALRKLEERKRATAMKQKQAEIREWWEHARLVHEPCDDDSKNSNEEDDKEKRRLESAEKWRRSHDANDYSRWDEYLKDLDDPIAREQKAFLEEQKEKSDNRSVRQLITLLLSCCPT